MLDNYGFSSSAALLSLLATRGSSGSGSSNITDILMTLVLMVVVPVITNWVTSQLVPSLFSLWRHRPARRVISHEVLRDAFSSNERPLKGFNEYNQLLQKAIQVYVQHLYHKGAFHLGDAQVAVTSLTPHTIDLNKSSTSYRSNSYGSMTEVSAKPTVNQQLKNFTVETQPLNNNWTEIEPGLFYKYSDNRTSENIPSQPRQTKSSIISSWLSATSSLPTPSGSSTNTAISRVITMELECYEKDG